jgi:D-serine dehydratase
MTSHYHSLMTNLRRSISTATPVLWTNPLRATGTGLPLPDEFDGKPIGMLAVQEARARFQRFAPLLAKLFPELGHSKGQIESDLLPIASMQEALGLPVEKGKLWLKADHSLAVAGSVKARGGFHEVLEFTEKIALQHKLIRPESDYISLSRPSAREVFAKYQIAVGSTGNLGMSIGVMAAALGFRAVVHMSREAKEWKKERLRHRVVEVIEHPGDYEQAVSRGRQLALADPLCHFVDDERSTSLFLGYSACAFHLQSQLMAQCVTVDETHPLLVYIPCGVGGAPAGIAWGLHHVFGNNVHCYFAEPVQSPCFLIQMLVTDGKHPSIYDYGLTNRTEADGLAVPRVSALATETMQFIVAGSFTVGDATLFSHLKLLHATQGLCIEPSAAAGFSGPHWLQGDILACPGATHLIWTTGGSLVPDAEYQKFLDWSQAS